MINSLHLAKKMPLMFTNGSILHSYIAYSGVRTGEAISRSSISCACFDHTNYPLPAVSSPEVPAVCKEEVSFVSFSDGPLSFIDFKLPPDCGGGVVDYTPPKEQQY